MEYKEIVERLRKWANGDTCENCPEKDDLAFQAADAIVILMAENQTLRNIAKCFKAREEAAESALKGEKSYDTPLPPFDEDDPDVLYCQKCGSGEYLENEDGNRNNYCGQCGQRIDLAAYDAAIEAISGTGGG